MVVIFMKQGSSKDQARMILGRITLFNDICPPYIGCAFSNVGVKIPNGAEQSTNYKALKVKITIHLLLYELESSSMLARTAEADEIRPVVTLNS